MSQEHKAQIIDVFSDGQGREMVADKAAEIVQAETSPDVETVLFSYDRCEALYLEFLHISWAKAVVDFTPGNGTFALACIKARIPILVIARNAHHKAVLLTHFKATLTDRIADSADARFFRTDVELGLSTDKATPKRKPRKPRGPKKILKLSDEEPSKSDDEHAKSDDGSSKSGDDTE